MNMSVRHKLILINGEAGVGKSWLAKQIRNESLEFQSEFRRRADIVGFADPIRRTIKAMFPMRKLDTIDEWHAFKKEELTSAGNYTDGNPLTGRDLMILIGNTLRAHNPNHWIEVFLHAVRVKDSTNVYGFLHVCDDWGFPNEFHVPNTQEDCDLLTVYIGRERVVDGDYRQFPGDSRFDLSRHCHIRADTSSEALVKVLESIRNRGWNK